MSHYVFNAVLSLSVLLAGYASPATDLVYFLAASTTGELRRQHWHHILTLYHTTFTIAAARQTAYKFMFMAEA